LAVHLYILQRLVAEAGRLCMEAVFLRLVGPRREREGEGREELRKLRERSYLNEGLDELGGKEPEDVTVKHVGVNHVSVLSVHQDEAR
jgi:hypothetical protein